VSTYNIERRALANILAALRFWQSCSRLGERADYPHFSETGIKPYSDLELDELCESLNCGEIPTETRNMGAGQ